MANSSTDRGLIEALVADGRPLLSLTGLALLFAGSFALFQSASGQFLPHDMAFLGVTAEDLSAVAGGRLRNFMIHDRVAFGGSLLAIGWLYLWLAEFPLAAGEAWAWWALAASGTLGFASFLAYLGYGYLDTWHAAGSVALLPVFAAGLALSRRRVRRGGFWREILRPGGAPRWRTLQGAGRLLLLATGAAMMLGGGLILVIGMTAVFVPQDLAYMGLKPADLEATNPRLVPLIAHDRAGFGGGIVSCGLLVMACVWCGEPSRSWRQALLLAGGLGFGAAVGVHFLIGYTDTSHLLPAYLGCAMFALGIALETLGAAAGKQRTPL